MSLMRGDRDYLRSLVRMDIRKRERGLAKAERHPTQTQQEFDAFRKEQEEKLEFRRAVYVRLSAEKK